MSIPSSYKPIASCKAIAGCLVLIALAASGCTYSGGKLAYMMGLGKGPLIPAEHTFTDGKLLVFVDDTHDQVDWPAARGYLFDEVSQELIRKEATTKIIPQESIDALRLTMPDFRKRGCREIGERLGADEVLWIEIHDFLATKEFTDANDAAIWVVTVKVLNAQETKSRSRVRLWPRSPEGHLVSASLAASEIQMLSNRDAITRELAEKLGFTISRLFYEHREEDE